LVKNVNNFNKKKQKQNGRAMENDTRHPIAHPSFFTFSLFPVPELFTES